MAQTKSGDENSVGDAQTYVPSRNQAQQAYEVKEIVGNIARTENFHPTLDPDVLSPAAETIEPATTSETTNGSSSADNGSDHNFTETAEVPVVELNTQEPTIKGISSDVYLGATNGSNVVHERREGLFDQKPLTDGANADIQLGTNKSSASALPSDQTVLAAPPTAAPAEPLTAAPLTVEPLTADPAIKTGNTATSAGALADKPVAVSAEHDAPKLFDAQHAREAAQMAALRTNSVKDAGLQHQSDFALPDAEQLEKVLADLGQSAIAETGTARTGLAQSGAIAPDTAQPDVSNHSGTIHPEAPTLRTAEPYTDPGVTQPPSKQPATTDEHKALDLGAFNASESHVPDNANSQAAATQVGPAVTQDPSLADLLQPAPTMVAQTMNQPIVNQHAGPPPPQEHDLMVSNSPNDRQPSVEMAQLAGEGFLGSLMDFRFEKYVSRRATPTVYVLGILGIVMAMVGRLVSLLTDFTRPGFSLGFNDVLSLMMVPLIAILLIVALRVVLELAGSQFERNDYLRTIVADIASREQPADVEDPAQVINLGASNSAQAGPQHDISSAS